MAPPPFSYKVRVLAAIDAFYNPKHARPIRLASVEARYKRDCDSQKCTLPVSWRKRVLFTANKLVREGWLSTTNDGSYLLTPELRTTIETEKRRREVSPSSHDWNTFAAIVKAMEFPAGVPQAQNHAPSSTPAGRTRGRTSLVSPIVAIPARSPTGAAPSSNIFATRQTYSNVPPPNGRSTPNTRSTSGAGPSSVNTRRESSIPSSPHPSSAPRPAPSVGPSRDAHDIRREVLRGKKVRQSDPGPRLILGTPIPSPSSGARRSLGSSEQPTSASARRPPGVSTARRRTSGSNRRRHTMAVPIQPSQQQISFPAPVSKEIQFFPLKQALSARTRRALRRNALSEEMNNIDDERRAGQRRNREELAKLRAELAQNAERLRDLERELVAARYAPSEEPEPMSPIREDEEPERNDAPQAEYYDMDFAPLADSPAPPATPFRREMQSADGSGQETPVSARDKKIRDLEAMIEQLREDIKYREQEAAARAQEDEIFHDAEEQIFLEKSSSLMERIHDLEAERSKANDMAVAFEGAGEEIDADLDHVYTGPTADDFDDDVSDTEQLHDDMAFPSSAVDSAILVSSQVQASRTQTEINVYESESHSKISELEDQNGGLQRMIDNLTDRIQDMQEEVRDSQTGLAEQEETTEALKAEVLKLKNQKQTLRLRIIELEEMEGERLESMQDLMVQTDEVVDERAILLEEKAERLNIQVSELQEMVEAVDAEKRAVDVRLLETMDQVSRLEAAVEAGERSREDVSSQLQDLSKMIELLKKETSILEAERAEMAAEIDELRDQLAILDREIGELRVENAGLKQEVSIQAEKITGLEQTVDHLGKDKAALQESPHLLELDMETLEEAAQVAEETKDRLENEIEALRDELKSQTDATEAARRASGAFQRTISELRLQVDSLEKAIELSDQEKKSFLHNIDAFRIRVSDLEQQLKISGDHKENLEAQICRLNGQIHKLEEAVEVSETDKEKLEDTVETLQNRISQHQFALENASNNRSRLESDIAQLTAQVTSLQEATIASNSEKEGLEREIDFLQKQVSAFEATVKLSDDQTADLENEILDLNTQIDMFKQAEEAARSEKEQMEINMSGMMAQIQGLTGAGKIAQKEKEDLDKSIASLNLQINILEEERDDALAENRRLKLEITEYGGEIASLTSRLENSNRESESLKQNIEDLEEKVVFLEVVVQDAHGGNTRLRQDIDALNAEIRTLKQASALADEEKSMIQQKIRPYIHGEQSLDMAVEEVLTELVMEKNRADENERLRTELSKKIKILAQTDEGMDMGSLNPEETVERLTDRFREVRGYVEELYSQCAQSENSPFEGHELGDFAWTGSNEDALEVLRSLVGGLYEKLNEAQARTVETEKEKEKERKQRSLYGQYLDDIAITVGVEGEQLPAEEGVLGLVTFRLSELRQHIGSAGEKIEELQDSIQRKNDTIQSMEMDIEEAGEREAGLSRKLVDAAATHEATTLQLNRSYAQIERLNQLNQDKVTEIEDLRSDLEASSEKERRLLDTIDQQASEHDTTVRELERKRGEAVARLEKLLEEEVLAKTRAEHIAAERAREDGEIIRELEERAAGWRAQYDALNVRLDMMKADHEDRVAQLKDTIVGGEGRITSLSEELREVLETSERDISALEDQLRSARDEIANQNSALSKVSAERNDVSRQLEAEILSSRNIVAGLEKRISEIKDESQLQQSRDHSRLSDLKHELEAHKAKSLLEQEHSRAEIHARGEVIELHKARISELEALLDEAEESEAVLEEGIKSRESQLQLSYEEAAKIKEALEAERDKLMEELAELRIVMERTRTDLTSDIEGLRTILEGREVRINDLEAVVGILRSERIKLAETVQELEAEQIKYQDMLESERQSGLEAVQALSHQAEKYMVRFGEVKQQYIRESAKRQVEGKKASKRLREQDDEVDNDIADMLLHAPPTPASTIPRPLSVTHSAKKRESKRRKYDSGIGVEEEEEEEEHTSVVPA